MKPKNLANIRCCYCEVFLNKNTFTRDHIIPKHAGGNWVKPCCYDCNQEKGGMMLYQYRFSIEARLKVAGIKKRKKLQIKLRNIKQLQKQL